MSAINRILNLPVQLGITRHSNSKDRDPQQGGQGYSQQKKERNPSEEEAKKAFAILLAMESVKRNNLTVELTTDDTVPAGVPVYVLLVKNSAGAHLRGIRGSDILKLIEQGEEKTDRPESGRILDRRI